MSPVQRITKHGEPVLRKVSAPVDYEAIKKDLPRLLKDMFATMYSVNGVGLAAPQVHVSQQIAVIEVAENRRYPGEGPIPLTILINPKILAASKKQLVDWEGCLSINDFRGQVPRAESLDVEAFNRKGEKVKFHAQGFFARVIQHECDHLAGKVFLDRMPDLRTLSHLHEFMRYWHDS